MKGATVLLADPPWKFGDSLASKGKGRGAANHYRCLTPRQIEAFPLPPLAANCLLMLWRCSALQDEALAVMQCWGFKQKTELVWVKLSRQPKGRDEPPPRKLHFGMGRYLRGAHETCLIGVRGRVDVSDHSIRSVFAAPVQEHSRKPDYQYEVAQRLVPKGPYVELFGRRPRPGWTVLGDEVLL